MGSVGTKDTGTRFQFDPDKAGATFKSLPPAFRNNIQSNLALSSAMRDNLNSDKPAKMTDEWTAGLSGVKEKRKVITTYENGRLFYTVKNGNKILLKDGTVEQAANQVSLYYKKYIR